MANEREGQEQAGERRAPNPDLRAQRSESRATQTYAFFLKDLEAKANCGRELAEKAAQSVLCLLEMRLIDNEAKHLEAQLPRKVRDLLQRCPRHEGMALRKFRLEQFLAMVAEDLDTTPNEAERLSRAVFATVREHITEGEAEDVMGQLPSDLRALWMREA
ncbi:DUF2267 domain-containing protein [Pyxidicoccus parkwayensis]|uniref:DUF2267 domain-containing protein n=1 Tax=Pyxidicoccus parkwayensis TaxID=2813578 RepID=A0ABX7NRG8_9BACT|nr:DUF2267 domain-containing protein [Pyxidicoccus parkwaysis]QSQ21476.1 DUF2267 domain-containing protein [Pyxidicoccus parkwaysis]